MTRESYIHKTSAGEPGAPLFFVFHGTGATEDQFFGVAREFLPEATIIAPRGDVSEHGAARYFRRTGEGVYDMADLAERTAKMIAFVRVWKEEARPSAVIGLGYSNGANILASVMFEDPELFDAAVLMHPLIPFQPQVKGTLGGRKVLITAGRRDPICPADLTQSLEDALSSNGAQVQTVWHEGGHEVRPTEINAAHAFLGAYR